MKKFIAFAIAAMTVAVAAHAETITLSRQMLIDDQFVEVNIITVDTVGNVARQDLDEVYNLAWPAKFSATENAISLDYLGERVTLRRENYWQAQLADGSTIRWPSASRWSTQTYMAGR